MATLQARLKARACGYTGVVPVKADLEIAELVVNTADGLLYTKHNDNTVKTIGGNRKVEELSNVEGEPESGDLLIFDGTNWQTQTLPAEALPTINLDDLGDVDVSTLPPAEGQALVWDATAGKWEPGIPVVDGTTVVQSVNGQVGHVSIGMTNLADYYPRTRDPDSTSYSYREYVGSSFSSPEDGKFGSTAFGPTLGTYDSDGNNLGALFDGQRSIWISTDGGISWLQSDYTNTGNTSWGGNGCTILYDATNWPTPADAVTELLIVFENPGEPVPLPLRSGDVPAFSAIVNGFKPRLVSNVGWSGDYEDLINKPQIPTDVPTSLADLDDVDTTTTPPTNGQLLAWDEATLRWKPADAPAAAVSSVQGKTGDVRLNIQEMDDYALIPSGGPTYIWSTYGTNPPVGSISVYQNSPTYIILNAVDADGVDWSDSWSDGSIFDTGTVFDIKINGVLQSGFTVGSVGNGGAGIELFQVTPNAWYDTVQVGDEIQFLIPTFPVDGIPLAEGDILQWRNVDQKFKPGQLSYNDLTDLPDNTGAGTVTSVNGDAGPAVELDLVDMNDVEPEIVPGTQPSWSTLADGTGTDRKPLNAGEWGFFLWNEANRQLRINFVDGSGFDWDSQITGLPASGELYVSTNSTDWQLLPYSSKSRNTSDGYWSFQVSPQFPPTSDGELWVSVNPPESPQFQAWEQGDHLEFIGNKWKPVQLAAVAKSGRYEDLKDLPTIPTRIQDQDDFELHPYVNNYVFTFDTISKGGSYTPYCNSPLFWWWSDDRWVAKYDRDGALVSPAIQAAIDANGSNQGIAFWYRQGASTLWIKKRGNATAFGSNCDEAGMGSIDDYPEGGTTFSTETPIQITFSEPDEEDSYIPLQDNQILQWSESNNAFMPQDLDPVFSGDYDDLTNKPDLSLKADLVNGVVPIEQIPAIAISEYLGTVADEAEMLQLTGESGDWCVRADTGTAWILNAADATNLQSWVELGGGSGGVSSVNGFIGAVSLGIQDMNDFELAEVPGNSVFLTSKVGYPVSADGEFSTIANTPWPYFTFYNAGNDNVEFSKLVPGDELIFTIADGTEFVSTVVVKTLNGQTEDLIQITDSWPSAFQTANTLTVNSPKFTAGTGVYRDLAEGDILQWNVGDGKFKPAQLQLPAAPEAPVQSVQSKTGDVRLNIQEMDDYALNDATAIQVWSTCIGQTTIGSGNVAGEWGGFESAGDSICSVKISSDTGDVTNGLLALQPNDIVKVNGVEREFLRSNDYADLQGEVRLTFVGTGFFNYTAGSNTLTLESARFAAGKAPLASGDILQWDDSDQAFKPVALPDSGSDVESLNDLSDVQYDIQSTVLVYDAGDKENAGQYEQPGNYNYVYLNIVDATGTGISSLLTTGSNQNVYVSMDDGQTWSLNAAGNYTYISGSTHNDGYWSLQASGGQGWNPGPEDRLSGRILVSYIPDNTTVILPPNENDILQWKLDSFRPVPLPSAPVNSVQDKTGDVRLNIQEMDDFKLNPRANEDLGFLNRCEETTDISVSSDFAFANNSSSLNFFAWKTGTHADTVQNLTVGDDVKFTSPGLPDFTSEVTDGPTVSESEGVTYFRTAEQWPTEWINTPYGSLPITVSSSKITSGDTPLIQNDILQWNEVDQKFKPSQLSSLLPGPAPVDSVQDKTGAVRLTIEEMDDYERKPDLTPENAIHFFNKVSGTCSQDGDFRGPYNNVNGIVGDYFVYYQRGNDGAEISKLSVGDKVYFVFDDGSIFEDEVRGIDENDGKEWWFSVVNDFPPQALSTTYFYLHSPLFGDQNRPLPTPDDGDVIQWDGNKQKYVPAPGVAPAPVDSVNEKTGAVVLGVNDMVDVQTYTSFIFNSVFRSNPKSGELNSMASASEWYFSVSKTDKNGKTVDLSGLQVGDTVYNTNGAFGLTSRTVTGIQEQTDYYTINYTGDAIEGSGGAGWPLANCYNGCSPKANNDAFADGVEMVFGPLTPPDECVLQWDETAQKYKPAVLPDLSQIDVPDSVFDLNDVKKAADPNSQNLQYNTQAASYEVADGEWFVNSDFMYIAYVDSNGVDQSANFKLLEMGDTVSVVDSDSWDYYFTIGNVLVKDDDNKRLVFNASPNPDNEYISPGAITFYSSKFLSKDLALADGQILTYSTTDSAFIPKDSTGPQRITETQQSQWDEVVFFNLGSAGTFVEVTCSEPAFVTFYSGFDWMYSTDPIDEWNRPETQDPERGSGVLLDLIFTQNNQTLLITPTVGYFNREPPPPPGAGWSDVIYNELVGRVRSVSGNDVTLTVTATRHTVAPAEEGGGIDARSVNPRRKQR